ncbi:MAG: PHP domain-containing protein [Oscillospiraceae bacterium]|nr:PHP domain-containing protein [Oscillospiraceae bacterium]MCD7742684.1 PHP domain-containing protein [Oscillospiraceae bacterium]
MANEKRIDLHIHTTASDGTLTPTEVVRRARELDLSAIAITDHDTHAGVAEGMAAAAEYGVEVVPGIELSIDYHGRGIHLLGYFVPPDSAPLQSLLDWVVQERDERNRTIAAAMCADGIPITMERLKARYPGAVIGRPHFAAALAELGYARDVQDAFARYISIGQKYFRKREYIPLQRAFDTLHAAGGKAVFAHPFQYRLSEPELLALTQTFVDAGLCGIECIYSGYTAEQTACLERLAARYDLCVTGGSDYHGTRKPHIEMGSGTGGMTVPYALLEALRGA